MLVFQTGYTSSNLVTRSMVADSLKEDVTDR